MVSYHPQVVLRHQLLFWRFCVKLLFGRPLPLDSETTIVACEGRGLCQERPLAFLRQLSWRFVSCCAKLRFRLCISTRRRLLART